MPDCDDCADMIVHLARLAQAGSVSPGLSAAQWMALRYFARANRFSRTPSAFSEFHATTRGTASQTVKALVATGLLRRCNSETDGRSALIDVTDAGRAMLARDPMSDLREVLGTLSPDRRAALGATLRATAEALARTRAAPVFGRCEECSHCTPAERGVYCRATRAELDGSEMQALCVDFLPRTGAEPGSIAV